MLREKRLKSRVDMVLAQQIKKSSVESAQRRATKILACAIGIAQGEVSAKIESPDEDYKLANE